MSKKHFLAAAAASLALAFAGAAQASTPTYYLQQPLTTNTPGNVFGNAVAVSGSIALVAANNRTVGGHPSRGAVYVYTYADGAWALTATLTTSDGGDGDSFGTSVALSGTSTAIIGAPLHGAGAAYIFTRSGSKWTQAAELTPGDGAGGDEFGFTVALDNTTAAVGALGHNGFEGAAYVYSRPESGWVDSSTAAAELTPADGAAMDEFGFSVAVKDDTVVVGSPEHEISGNIQQGQVYVFVKPDTGWVDTSTATALLSADDGGAQDQLGYSVATTGTVILAGAPTHTASGKQPGGAYLYFKPDTGWVTATQDNNLTNATFGTPSGGLFGSAVAISNSLALVGTKWAKVGSHGKQGEIYFFKHLGSSWATGAPTLGQIITAEDGNAKAAFGYSVATDGTSLLVGAPHYVDSIQSVPGEAYALKVTKLSFEFSDGGQVSPGHTYEVQGRVTNTGTSLSQDVKLEMSVSGGAHVFSVAALQAKCTHTTTSVTCDFGKLAAKVVTPWMQVRFMDTAAVGQTLTNTVQIVGFSPALPLSDEILVVKP